MNQVWCPWCRTWVDAIQHVGPGYYCSHCRGYLGMDTDKIAAVKPGAHTSTMIEPKPPQGELSL